VSSAMLPARVAWTGSGSRPAGSRFADATFGRGGARGSWSTSARLWPSSAKPDASTGGRAGSRSVDKNAWALDSGGLAPSLAVKWIDERRALDVPGPGGRSESGGSARRPSGEPGTRVPPAGVEFLLRPEEALDWSSGGYCGTLAGALDGPMRKIRVMSFLLPGGTNGRRGPGPFRDRGVFRDSIRREPRRRRLGHAGPSKVIERRPRVDHDRRLNQTRSPRSP